MVIRINQDEAREIFYNQEAVFQGRYYAYKDNDVVKGIVCILFRSWFLSEIRHLYVLPEFRQQGIGTVLVREAVELTRTPLVCGVVREDNSHSLKILRKLGFLEERIFTNSNTGNRVILMLK